MKEITLVLFFCRRQKFLYELNTSGKYFAFKEQLKVAQTISIVQYMQYVDYTLLDLVLASVLFCLLVIFSNIAFFLRLIHLVMSCYK